MFHELLWHQLLKLDRQDTAERAICSYCCETDSHIITMLKSEYLVEMEKRDISRLQPGTDSVKAGFIEQLCILSYLINSSQLPPSKKPVKAESLPGGAFFFRGPHVLPTAKLEDVFGANPELLYSAIEGLGAEKCDFGDASIELQVLPRVKITFIVWARDDEFRARASILFDETVSKQLPLDSLQATVNLVVDAIIQSTS
ncbi:MAG: DUF3786 domain-containing protein [Planctomycetes bacterium]|nr:DUF3786 domain-containing protein [Planctomycetota bacterium]